MDLRRREFLGGRATAPSDAAWPAHDTAPGATAARIRIAPSCLAARRIECRVCGEVCEAGAISFRPTLGSVAQPVFDASACTGCADCVAPCPVAAITRVAAAPP